MNRGDDASPAASYQYKGENSDRVSGTGLLLLPTDPAPVWQLKLERLGGGNFQEDPVTERMEVEDVILVLGYEWED